jgi:predicted transcriptional regulator
MEKGFIMLSRKFFSNRIWEAARTFSECEAWLDLIQSARFEATDTTECIGGREITYGRGQYPASIRFLSKKWSWSERTVRTFLSKLTKEKMITTDNSQGMNVITLCKYNDYNGSDTVNDTVSDTDINQEIKRLTDIVTQLTTQLSTQPRHTGDTNLNKEEEYINSFKETSTSVEAKKAEQAKKLAAAKAATLKRKEDFYNSLVPYVVRYGKEMIRAFFDYWSELNKSETKMRLETEKTWELARRLSTWANREKVPKEPKKSNFTNHDNNKEYTDF